jgi:hypothetical protein
MGDLFTTGSLAQVALDPLGVFSKPKIDLPPIPMPEPVPVMPTPDDEAVRKARGRSVAYQRSRQGRVSTIFTSDLGG